MKQLPARILVMLLAAALAAQTVGNAGARSGLPGDGGHPVSAARVSAQGPASTHRMIVRFRDAVEGAAAGDLDGPTLQRLRAASGLDLAYLRRMSGGAHVLQLPGYLSVDEARAVGERLMALPEVDYAEPDRMLRPALAPDDPRYGEQWHYHGEWGIEAPAAWDLTTGSASIVVAVIDTGITDHADLRANTLPGYDFISDIPTAGDGDGRDVDAADPGDWVSGNDCPNGVPPHDSSWHGTHVAGTIAAVSDNGLGVAGISWKSKILPVRILGTCGGFLSDAVDAARWAAGLPVPGVPSNPHPARVLNMSFGEAGPCGTTLQGAIDSVTAAGAVVVAAAGNELSDASGSTPANCRGVITVGATDEAGDLALYSNYGAALEISAPGGFFTGVLSTSNAGATVPAADSYVTNIGTSMAAPHVSGVVALMLARNPHLTPAQVLQILQKTARPFPAGGLCQLFLPCGAGLLDAGAAVAAVPVAPAQSFADVPAGHWAWDYIERLYRAGMTGGCQVDPLRYCPENPVTRAQMAVFLLRGIHGAVYAPPDVGAGTGFGDVPAGHWAAAWIKQLAKEGITSGCGGGSYCPEAPVTRAQMAVFLLRAKYGASYIPPGVGPVTGFGDVPASHWAAPFIKQLAAEGITSGCGGGSYCPEAPVTRAEMAVFLVRAFSLP